MALRAKLEALLAAVLEEAERNPGFAARLEAAICRHRRGGRSTGTAPDQAVPEQAGRPGDRRARPRRASEKQHCATRSRSLTVDQLKDIVAAHALDRTGKALRWKTRARLIDLIVTEATTRMRKGGAFLSG
ncbi:MAG: hypothetical protein RML45_12955 [Acetobacteraceae bacterium]|nr:hypothetical protein [Acetobacteraceae bacterium]